METPCRKFWFLHLPPASSVSLPIKISERLRKVWDEKNGASGTEHEPIGIVHTDPGTW